MVRPGKPKGDVKGRLPLGISMTRPPNPRCTLMIRGTDHENAGKRVLFTDHALASCRAVHVGGNSMSRVMSIAHSPPPTVLQTATVAQAVQAMIENQVGATAVVEEGKLRGIFTERDLMRKVVGVGKNPDTTLVSEVMTSTVEPISPSDSAGHALRVMTQRHFRHMPVCETDGTVLGVLSIRNVLQHLLDKLSSELDSLEAFLTADGPGG